MLDQLPVDSRFVKSARNDPLDSSDHLQLMVVDALNQILYQTALSAAADLGKDYKKYAQKAPKPIERPEIVPTVKERKFTSGKELKMMMREGGVPVAIPEPEHYEEEDVRDSIGRW